MLNSNNFSPDNNHSETESNQSNPLFTTDNKAISPERIEFYSLQKQFRQLKNGFPATELLEAGGVAEWLQLRAESLLSESNNNRMHGGLSQLLGLSVGVAAFALTGTAAAPVAPIAIGLGLFGYAASVADSALRLGRILPIPFNGFTLQKLAVSTSADGREALKETNYDIDPQRAEKLAFLPTSTARELEMLVDYQGMILELLSNLPEGKRFAIYYVLRKAYVEGGFGNNTKEITKQINKLADTVSPDTTLDEDLMCQIKGKLNPPEEKEETLSPIPQTFIEKMTYRLPVDEVRQECLLEEAKHNPEELINAIAENVGNLIICSPGGGGKGIVISNALRQVKKLHPDIHIFYIDPKADPKEKGYLTGCVDTYRSFKTLGADPEKAVAAYESFWEEFYLIKGRKLLVLDEATTMGIKYALVKKADLLKSRVGELPSLGGSEGVSSWIVCQNPHVSDLGINTGILSQFARLALLCTKKGEASASFDMMNRTKFTANNKYVFDDVRVLCDKSPRDRAFFYSKFDEWLPMPEMTNYSGYDRDSNTFITPPEAPAQLPETEAPTVIQNQENNTDKTDKLDKLFNQGLSSQYAELTEDALNVLNKLKEAVADTRGEPVKVKTVCDKHPLGRDRKSAAEIRYYLGELVISNLAQKIGEEPSEIYLPIE